MTAIRASPLLLTTSSSCAREGNSWSPPLEPSCHPSCSRDARVPPTARYMTRPCAIPGGAVIQAREAPWRCTASSFATRPPPHRVTRSAGVSNRAANVISVLSDLARRCPAVDLDDHHLCVSRGCATENPVQAALAHGLAGTVNVEPARGHAINIALEPTPAIASSLFAAIPRRQCTRGNSTAGCRVHERFALQATALGIHNGS